MPKEEREATRKAATEGQFVQEEHNEASALLTSAALVGIGAIIAPELLTGMAVGAGIVLASKWFPTLAKNVVRPLAKSAVKASYAAATAAREMVAEAAEQVEDLMAEARAEREAEDRQLH